LGGKTNFSLLKGKDGIRLARESLHNLFTGLIPVIVVTGTLLISIPTQKLKARESMLNQLRVTGVIKRRGQSIMPAPLLSMTFNVKTVIKISTI
jgi:hypothetical protein